MLGVQADMQWAGVIMKSHTDRIMVGMHTGIAYSKDT